MQNRIQIAVGTLALALMAASSVATAGDKKTQLGVWKPSAPFTHVNGRIVGGVSAVGNRSFVVRTSGCGGTIIADSWVLTAAHCGSQTRVYAGSNNTGSQTSYTVAQYIAHPSYNSSTQAHDYALIKITGTFPTTLTRAKLPDASIMQAVAKAGDPVTTLGWGATSEGGSGTSSLREVTVPVISDATCNSASYYNGGINAATMICAGLAAGGKDSCQGDSGGPLIAPYNGSIYSIGVVSWGDGCARANKPGVYSEVITVADWIRSKIGTVTPPVGTTYSNTADYQIADNATVDSPITVANATGSGSATTPVAVNIVHTYKGDLKVDLIAPDGSVYVLHNRAGGSADNINQTFTVNLSSEAKNGIWKLRVNDNANGDTGKIDSWSLTF